MNKTETCVAKPEKNPQPEFQTAVESSEAVSLGHADGRFFLAGKFSFLNFSL